jgi:hypothetical protein
LWIKEVEISVNSDFDGQEVADADIQSGTIIFIHSNDAQNRYRLGFFGLLG